MIYTIAGSNDFLRSQSLHSRVSSYKKKYGTYELEHIIANEVEIATILQRMQSMPFLSAKKCIVIYDLSVHKADYDKIESACTQIPKSTEIILYEQHLDKRTRYATMLQKTTNFHEYKDLDDIQLIRWLVETAEQQDGELSMQDAEELLKRVGSNQFQLYSELQKLLTRNRTITRKLIEEMVDATPQSSVFALIDAASAGDVSSALTILDEQRQQNVEPHMLLGHIIGHITTLATIREAPRSARPEAIARQSGIHPFVVKKNLQHARGYSRQEIQKIIAMLRAIDEGYKHSSMDMHKALQFIVVFIGNLKNKNE